MLSIGISSLPWVAGSVFDVGHKRGSFVLKALTGQGNRGDMTAQHAV